MESDKGSFYNQKELLDELEKNLKQAESCAKILFQETVEAEEMTKKVGRLILGILNANIVNQIITSRLLTHS